MLRPEQSSAALMRDFVQKSSKPNDFVSDAFARILFTAKGCLLLDHHREFVRCNKDSVFVEKSMAGLVEVYSCQLLNKASLI